MDDGLDAIARSSRRQDWTVQPGFRAMRWRLHRTMLDAVDGRPRLITRRWWHFLLESQNHNYGPRDIGRQAFR